ncbi:MAG: hypothetical protein HPY44_03520 [Armatimonadetes bacterium]|nr:hypothetical protein [Armatimonadota bacterium]
MMDSLARFAFLVAVITVCSLPAGAAPGRTAYLCKIGQAPRTLAVIPDHPPREELAGLRQWDLVAVQTIARAARGEAPLSGAVDMLLALLNGGPFAGAFRDESAAPDPFLEIRARRFLDAASRIHSGLPADLLRELLGDEALVAELSQDDSGSARRGGHFYFAQRLGARSDQAALLRLLPALLTTRGHTSDRELVARCMSQLDRGIANSDLADLLSRTILWDLRLYLLYRSSAESRQEALMLEDSALEAEYRETVSAMHLRYFLLGARERKDAARLWDQLDAAGFMKRHPDCEWVGYAAALCRELTRGTVLVVDGDTSPVLLRTGNTVPLTYTVAPGEAASFARLSVPDSDLPPGMSWQEEPAVVEYPEPISGKPWPSGLRFSAVFTKPGSYALSLRPEIAGIPLPVISHPIQVQDASAASRPEQAPESSGLERLALQVPVNIPGYEPFSEPSPTGDGVLYGVRRFIPLSDGQHGMEHQVMYEIHVGPAGAMPPEVAYCDPKPGPGASAREQILAQALENVSQLVGEGFALAPGRARVVGRDCWVGRQGKGQDDRYYYVLCRGRQQYYKRNTAFLYQTFWDALIGEQPVYDARQVQADTEAVAEAVLGALQVIGGASEQRPTAVGPIARGRAVEFLDQARAILETDGDLVRRLDLTAATWKQKRLENAAAAQTVAEDIVGGYDMLAAQVEAMVPPDDALTSVLDDVKAVISIGVAASRLVEKGMRSGEEEKVDRGMALLHGHDPERQRLRTQSMTLKLEYAER